MSGETRQINLLQIRLDLKEGRLWNGERPVDLRPKTWELIRYMVKRPGELLSKQELIDAVWPDTIVTEASLNQAIHRDGSPSRLSVYRASCRISSSDDFTLGPRKRASVAAVRQTSGVGSIA